MKNPERSALHKLKQEGVQLLVAFAAFYLILQAVFLKENPLIVIRTALAIFWTLTLPGFALMSLFFENLEFIERLLIGTVLGLAVIGVVGYNLGLLGINMTVQIILIPSLEIAVAGFVLWKKTHPTAVQKGTDQNL